MPAAIAGRANVGAVVATGLEGNPDDRVGLSAGVFVAAISVALPRLRMGIGTDAGVDRSLEVGSTAEDRLDSLAGAAGEGVSPSREATLRPAIAPNLEAAPGATPALAASRGPRVVNPGPVGVEVSAIGPEESGADGTLAVAVSGFDSDLAGEGGSGLEDATDSAMVSG